MKEPVFERIEMCLKEQKKTQKELITTLKMSRASYSNWNLGKSKSYLKRIDEIAAFFGVSPNYLLRGIEDAPNEGTRSASEDELLRLFRILNPDRQECIVQVARALIIEEKKEKIEKEAVG